MKIRYYTDGSCRNNGRFGAAGAYGFVRVEEDYEEELDWFIVGILNETNQRAELGGVLAACGDAQNRYGEFDDIEIISDSAYCINCIHQGWYKKWLTNGWLTSKKEPVANRDLWEKLIPFFELSNFTFTKTKGHADDKYNNLIDKKVQKMSADMRNVQHENNNR